MSRDNMPWAEFSLRQIVCPPADCVTFFHRNYSRCNLYSHYTRQLFYQPTLSKKRPSSAYLSFGPPFMLTTLRFYSTLQKASSERETYVLMPTTFGLATRIKKPNIMGQDICGAPSTYISEYKDLSKTIHTLI